MESVDMMLKCVFVMMVLLTIPSLAQAQIIPGYSTYTNNHFTVQYPSGWLVYRVVNGVYFWAYKFKAEITIGVHTPAPSWLLNKDTWITGIAKHGAIITTINNDTNYLSNRPALVAS